MSSSIKLSELNKTGKFYTVEETVTKLMKTWEKHGTLIIASDFDDTLFNYSNNPTKDFSEVHKLLRQCVDLGLKVVVFTARHENKFHEVVEYCNDINLKIEGINVNVVDHSDKIGTSGKIYYNLLLDDKAGLIQAYVILKKVVTRIKAVIG